MAISFPSFQLQFPWDVISDENARDLMMLISFLGVPFQPLGQRILQSRRAQALLRHMPGPDANSMQPLCIRGRSVPYHVRQEGPRALGGGWLQGQAAGTAITQPCVHTRHPRDQQPPGTKPQDEGCKYTSPSCGYSWPGQGGRNGRSSMELSRMLRHCRRVAILCLEHW